MQKGALPGFRDFYPEDFAKRAHIFDVWGRVARSYGFEEYDGPPLEPLSLYTEKSGEDIVRQLYHFRDKGEREVALRPEMTPTLARMVAARANGLKKPIRWFSTPQLFRYERKQRGRMREHFQLNCDLIGEGGPRADAEIIALAIDVLRGFGLTAADFRVRLSDRRLVQLILLGFEIRELHHDLVFRVLDRYEKSTADELTAELGAVLSPHQVQAVLRIPTVRGSQALLNALPRHLITDLAVNPLFQVMETLRMMGLGEFVEIDLTIVRGLAYYTGTVFEIFDSEGEMRAICGGGRYDSLTRAIGGVAMPAVGFGMGDVVLGDLLEKKGLVRPSVGHIDAFLCWASEDDRESVLRFGHGLRGNGVRVEYCLSLESMTKQLKLADARGARFVLVFASSRDGLGVVQIKDGLVRAQTHLPLGEAAQLVTSEVRRTRAIVEARSDLRNRDLHG